jgi:outer membrane protein assembly factor BamA
VVDAVDQNLAGRGVTLGARARYGDDDRSARLYSSLPRLLGTGASLQLFTEYLEHEDQAED